MIHRTRLTRIAPAREPTEDACRSFAGRREKPQEYASSFLVADAPHPHAGPAGKGYSSSRLPIFRMRGRIGEPLETAWYFGSDRLREAEAGSSRACSGRPQPRRGWAVGPGGPPSRAAAATAVTRGSPRAAAGSGSSRSGRASWRGGAPGWSRPCAAPGSPSPSPPPARASAKAVSHRALLPRASLLVIQRNRVPRLI